MLRKALISIFLGVILFLAGCGIHISQEIKENNMEQVVNGFPVTIENYNSLGEKVKTTYHKSPKRIIALWQNSIETLIQLGASENIVAAAGISDENHLTKEDREIYKKLPVVTKQNLNQEAAVALNPDFILGWLFDFTGKANSVGTWGFWHDRSVPVYMTKMNMGDFLDKHVVEDELTYISDVGNIVGKQSKAEEIISSIKTSLNRFSEYGKQQNKFQKVLIISSLSHELHVYTPRTLPGDIVTRLGGYVMGKEVESVGNTEVMSIESVILQNPDVIFIQSNNQLSEELIELVADYPGLKEVKAVRNKRIYTVPFYTIRCPSVRVLDAIEIFAKGLYPEIE